MSMLTFIILMSLIVSIMLIIIIGFLLEYATNTRKLKNEQTEFMLRHQLNIAKVIDTTEVREAKEAEAKGLKTNE